MKKSVDFYEQLGLLIWSNGVPHMNKVWLLINYFKLTHNDKMGYSYKPMRLLLQKKKKPFETY